MWEKKIYPLDKTKKKSKGIRKQRHHAVSSNKLLMPDRRGTSNQRAHWSRLDYGSASWMLSQLAKEFEFDDGFNDFDNDDDMDYADGDVTDMGYIEPVIDGVEIDRVNEPVYDQNSADCEGHGCDMACADREGHGCDMGCADHEGQGCDMACAAREVGEENDGLIGGVEEEEVDEAGLEIGYVYVEFERDLESEDEWCLVG